MLDDLPQGGAHRDPHLLEVFGRARIVEVFGTLPPHIGQRAFQGADHVSHGDLRWIAIKAVTPIGPAHRTDQPRGAQLGQDPLEELKRDRLRLGDDLALDPLAIGCGQRQERPHSVIDLGGHMHDPIVSKWQDARVPHYILTLQCADQSGLVRAISGALLEVGANIVEQAQFTDPGTNQFFLRTRFQTHVSDVAVLTDSIGAAVAFMEPDFHVWREERKQRVLIMVSQQDHCLIDLLYRMDIGELPIEVPVIVSNHETCAAIADRHGIPFVCLPVTAQTKVAQEARLLDLVREYEIDLIVLARYMQILSEQVCTSLPGRIINIHHSFLPGFKGANPYTQAYDRGVKLIGATAHFVTADLDEGPIIDQDVQRVSHSRSPEQLAAIGRDTERLVLARAVRHAAEHRIFINGHRTVVFD